MSRLATLHGRRSLVPYLCLGDPSPDASVELALALAAAGADAIELGVPFSDPLADGPVIQAAGQRALRGGFRLADAFATAARIRAGLPSGRADLPLCFMVYSNNVLALGTERFAARAAEAGADGLIVPDLPLEETAGMAAACRAHGVDLIAFVAPTTPDARIPRLTAAAGGFVYCVSLTGVTGARDGLSGAVPAMVARVRPHTDLPLLVGFGIATPEAAAQAARLADGAIVGSALVQLHHEQDVGAAAEFVARLAQAVHAVGRAGSA